MVGITAASRKVMERMERQQREGIVECSLREPTGGLSRLVRRWRAGRAHLEPGRIVFQPFLPLGLRVLRPRTDPIVVPVRGVDRESRRPRGRELLWVTAPIVVVATDRNSVQWAIPAPVLEWAVAQVDPATES